jgi:hypothetical protein
MVMVSTDVRPINTVAVLATSLRDKSLALSSKNRIFGRVSGVRIPRWKGSQFNRTVSVSMLRGTPAG